MNKASRSAKLKLAFFLMMTGTLASCGAIRIGGGSVSSSDTHVTYYAIDGVKAIRPDITIGEDDRSYLQSKYDLSPSSRLLIRFESLASYSAKIYLSDGHDIWMRVVMTRPEDVDTAIRDLRLCPLTRNWVMIATWRFAHPFDKSGKWGAEGGDYDNPSCVSAIKDPGTKLPDETTVYDGYAVYFKVTRWYKDFVVGRSQNLGHLLMNAGSTSLTIFGDTSASYSPRIQWSETGISSDSRYHF